MSQHRYRFFGQELDGENGNFWRLHDSEHRHMKSVLRLSEGTEVEVTDGDGQWIEGRLARVTSKSTDIEVVASHTDPAPDERVEIALGALKPGAVDEILPSLIELGIDALHVVLQEGTARARLTDKAKVRWGRIAVQSVKQCKRSRLPGIVGHESLDAFLASLDGDLKDRLKGRFLLSPDADLDLLEASSRVGEGDCLAMIGGERGFTEAEELRIRGMGFLPVRLGPHVLRARTAAVAATALLATRRFRGKRKS